MYLLYGGEFDLVYNKSFSPVSGIYAISLIRCNLLELDIYALWFKSSSSQVVY